MRCICCKAGGISALTFCVGMLGGMVFPEGVIAVLEGIMLLFVGYCCIFKW